MANPPRFPTVKNGQTHSLVKNSRNQFLYLKHKPYQLDRISGVVIVRLIFSSHFQTRHHSSRWPARLLGHLRVVAVAQKSAQLTWRTTSPMRLRIGCSIGFGWILFRWNFYCFYNLPQKNRLWIIRSRFYYSLLATYYKLLVTIIVIRNRKR